MHDNNETAYWESQWDGKYKKKKKKILQLKVQ